MTILILIERHDGGSLRSPSPILSLIIPGSRLSLRHSYYPYYRDPLDGKGEDDVLPISLLPTS